MPCGAALCAFHYTGLRTKRKASLPFFLPLHRMVWADARFLCKEETSLDDNRAMRAESGVGTLPNGCCAPLAFPYVPVQKNDPERYSQQDALKAGTLFPGLNLPFHAQMKTKFPAVNTALSELMALDFAIDELGLYLTTHPEDTEVLNLYWSYIKLGREGREAYEKQYGPILQTDVTPGSFKWLNDPWPWDLEGEK